MRSRSPAADRAATNRTRGLAQAIERLEDLYAQLPELSCLGLCEDSCRDRIDASTAERRRLQAAGVALDTPTPDGAYPALTRTFGTGRYSVHHIRPTICRLWGTAASMPCPHGCTPTGGLVDDAQVTHWLLTNLDIGGHPDFGDITPQIRDLLEQALSNPPAAAALARMLRGDRSAAGTFYARLRPPPPAP